MTKKTTNFQDNVQTSQDQYLWSNAANWANGLPVNGDYAILDANGESVDDIANLSLSDLTEAGRSVIQADLTVSQDVSNLFSHMIVQGATVTFGTIVNPDGEHGRYDAWGTGGTIVDESATDQGEAFSVSTSGEVELFAIPASTSTFEYEDDFVNGMGVDGGTFAFKSLAATNAMLLDAVAPSDVLEVPGTSVSAVSFGTGSLSVTTSAGTYAFTNVTYAAATAGYTAAVDPVTGLVAITFNDVNTFQQTKKATSGPLSGDYLWSNAANWTGGVPANASDFTVIAAGDDDLASLRLVNLTLDKTGAEPEIQVTGAALTVADLLENSSGGTGLLEADAKDAGAPVTVTLGQNDAHGVTFEANGAGATLLDDATAGSDAGTYVADNGGVVEILNAPLFTDILSYGTNGVFAFKTPAANNISLIEGVAAGDAIELPGTAVSSVTFGDSSLTVTTNIGTYSFGDVGYTDQIDNYSAAVDPTSGLVAITFRGANTFTPTAQIKTGQPGYIQSLSGFMQFLWSNAANWTEGAPVNGDSILTTYKSLSTEYQLPIDDIQNLTLTGLTLALSNHVWVDHSLTVGTLTENYDTLIGAVSTNPAAPAVLTIGATVGAPYDSEIFATGAGATVIDRSADLLGAYVPGMIYYVSLGGTLEFLSGAPAPTSNFEFFDPTGEGGGGEGTIAFGAPGPVVSAALQYIAPKDVLELPGISVSSVVFGTTSLTVTTDAGTVAFTNVTYGNEVTGYIAAPDPATGLVAITFTGVDTFSDTVKAATGPLAGDFLWSNAANWSDGVPVDGSSVQYTPLATGYDDLAALNLSGLNIVGGQVWVTGSSLNVASISAGEITSGGIVYESGVSADAADAGSPVAVTVGTITGTGGYFVANGAGASFVGPTAADPGHTVYGSEDGGVVRLPVTPADTSALNYGGGQSTVELDAPAATSNGNIFAPQPGDVLELPGKSVSNVTFGASSFDVTTDAGTYAFTNVTYGNLPVTGYTAAPDATTGLVAITFTGPDVFSANVKATSGPLAGKYLWSNAANWSQGVPLDGSAVQYGLGAVGYDDLAALNLSELNPNGGDVYVTGRSLTVSTLAGGDLRPQSPYIGTFTVDAADAGGPVTVTIGTITGTGGQYYAKGAGASFQDQSVTGPADIFNAEDDGLIQFAATPAGADLEYGSGPSTFALDNPGTTNAVALENVAPGDVLELPGTSVSEVSFGKASLSVTTSAGTYAFLIVGYDPNSPVTGYTAAQDATTGLVAITFTGVDTFSDAVKAATGPLAGDYLWSNAANWSDGVPVDGDDVSITQQSVGYDDIASLSLGTLTMNQATVNVVGSVLNVGTVVGGWQIIPTVEFSFLFADAVDAGAPVAVTAGDVTGIRSTYGATGAGGTFVDNSPSDPGNTYEPGSGGTVILAATQVTQSDFWYLTSPGTVALTNLASITASDIDYAADDVLELPGSTVSSVSFLGGNVTVVTDQGSYALRNDTSLTGYRWAAVAGTTLVAVTFLGPDTFEPNVKTTSGKFAGDYLWSNPANWSLRRAPIDGDDVSVTRQSVSYDDIAALSLGTLTMNQATVNVVSSVLTVGTVVGGEQITPTEFSFLFADAVDAGAPVTVTAGEVTGTRSTYGATGAGGTFVDNSPTDPGNTYLANNGGVFSLAATPDSTSDFYWLNGGPNTIELERPAATAGADFNYYASGDVLELPGASVSNVGFGPNSLGVTTDVGTYNFYILYEAAGAVNGYTAALDPSTGLVAITFTGVDTFSDNVKATSGPLSGKYLWSNAANWSSGAPVNGDSVAFTGGAVSDDDLAALSLSSLTIDNNAALTVTSGHLSVTGALTVGDVGGGSLTDSAGAEVTAASVAVGGQGRIVMAGGVLDPPIPISIAAGGSITGSGSIDGTVVATGTLAATGGLLKVDGAVSGTGTLAIGAGATLDLEGGAGLTQGGAISFGGAGSKLVVGAGQSVSGTVLGLGSGGDIDFAGQTVTTRYSQGVLTLLSGASTVGRLMVADTTAAEGFMTKADGQDGTDIVAVPSGTAVGDVHLMTFDGLHYNFQADGDFILARSTQTGNPFDVEIRTTPWTLNHLASLITQAGAQVGSHVIDFMLDGSVKIDGIADTALSAAHPQQRLDGGTLTALGSGRYQLDWAGKEGLTVTNEGFYLNLQTTLAATDGPGSVQGLLGTLQGQTSDLSLPDGTVLKQPVPDATLLGAFADGWRVDAGASLLDGTASLRPDTLGIPTSPNFLLADAPGELLTGSLGSAADAGVIIGGSLANLAGAVITNFAPRDFIDVTNLAGANATFQEIPSADGGQLTITGGFHSATLTLMGTGASAAVQYSSDHHGGTLLWVS